MNTFFGKIVDVVKPVNGYRLLNPDGSQFHKFSWQLNAIRFNDCWYALSGGPGGCSFGLISKDGQELGRWHEVYVRDIIIPPKTFIESLSLSLGIQKSRTERVLFGKLGSMESKIPQKLLDQALSTTNPEEVTITGSLIPGSSGSLHLHWPTGPRRYATGRRR